MDSDAIVIGGIYYNVPVGRIPWDPYGVEYPLLCLWMAKMVYLVLFEYVDFAKETKSFYAGLCGVELPDEDAGYLLAGKAPGGGADMNDFLLQKNLRGKCVFKSLSARL
mgnify:CR=1 FL=1